MYREENQDKQRSLPNLKRQGGGHKWLRAISTIRYAFSIVKKISEEKGMGKIQDSSLRGMHKGSNHTHKKIKNGNRQKFKTEKYERLVYGTLKDDWNHHGFPVDPSLS